MKSHYSSSRRALWARAGRIGRRAGQPGTGRMPRLTVQPLEDRTVLTAPYTCDYLVTGPCPGAVVILIGPQSSTSGVTGSDGIAHNMPTPQPPFYGVQTWMWEADVVLPP